MLLNNRYAYKEKGLYITYKTHLINILIKQKNETMGSECNIYRIEKNLISKSCINPDNHLYLSVS